jgi:DNA replication protein DnaC
MSKASSPTSSNTDQDSWRTIDTPGDPNCPDCHGLGYVRLELPVGHPEFGKAHICACRQEQVSQQVHKRLFQLSHLDELGHLTFDNFQPRGRAQLWPREAESLEIAFQISQHFAHEQNGWLLLQGDFGCGKTHLAAAIANFAVSLGVPTLFITVPDLLDALRFAFNDPEATFEERFDQIRQAPLLILDDFGTQNATPWAQEKLFQIVNYRYINHLPLVVTTNLSTGDIEERIQSRFQDPELVTRVNILAPDFRNPKSDMGHHKLSDLDKLHKCTFVSFVMRQDEELSPDITGSLEKAFNAAHRFAENPKGWIVFIGVYGCGKTHLAAAIANFRSNSASPPLFISIPDLMDHLRATFNPNSTVSLDRRFEEVRTAPLLILDDLGKETPSPWVREKLYQLFNYRYISELPTVITSSLKLEEMDARIRSRMLDKRLCTVYGITAPSFTGARSRKRPARQPKSTSKNKS